MANCHECYWADRDPVTKIQSKVEVPDFLNQDMAPGEEVPDVRIIQSCGKGKKWFKTYGAQEHNCTSFENEADLEVDEQMEVERRRKAWKSPTSRRQLPSTDNSLLIIERMAEGDNDAFDILTSIMSRHFDSFAKTLSIMDDMNIRGEQISHAFIFADRDIDTLVNVINDRKSEEASDLVAYVNDHYPHVDKEQAVMRGAHLYGHRDKDAKPSKPKKKLRKPRS